MNILKTKQEYEILSQILHFANGKKSLRSEGKLAQKLIAEFGSLKEVLDADITELHEYVSEKEASFISQKRSN